MQIVDQIVTPTVATVTEATKTNIKKLKVYLSNGNSRPNTKQKNK